MLWQGHTTGQKGAVQHLTYANMGISVLLIKYKTATRSQMPPPSVFKVLFEEAAQKSHSVMLLAHGADLYFNQLSCCRTLPCLKNVARRTSCRAVLVLPFRYPCLKNVARRTSCRTVLILPFRYRLVERTTNVRQTLDMPDVVFSIDLPSIRRRLSSTQTV